MCFIFYKGLAGCTSLAASISVGFVASGDLPDL